MNGLINAVLNFVSSFTASPAAKKWSRMTDADKAYIRTEYARGTALEVIGKKIGRSRGVVSQFLTHYAKDLRGRNPTKTRIIKSYGLQALAACRSPEEALRAINEAKRLALATAVGAAKSAKRKRYDIALATMREELASGIERDAAIFSARAAGLSLEEIASEFFLTRERIRQICNAHAGKIALDSLLSRASSSERAA